MSGIGKIFHTVAKHIDADDVTKLTKSKAIKDVASETASEIGEALANGLSKESSDVASTLIQEGADAVSTSASKKGFWGWVKGLFKNSSSDDIPDISTKNLCKGTVEQTADDLEKQIQTLQKQIDTSKVKSNKKTKSSIFKMSSEEKAKFKEQGQEMLTDIKNGWAAIKRETKKDIEWIKEKGKNIASWASLVYKSFKGEAYWSPENKCFITR